MEEVSIKKRRIEIDNDFDSSINGGSHEILSAEGADRDSPLSSPLETPPPASQDSIDFHSSECESAMSLIHHESDDDSGWEQFLQDTEHLTNEQLCHHVNHLIDLHQKAEEEEDSNYDECNETDVFAHNYINGWNGKRPHSFDV